MSNNLGLENIVSSNSLIETKHKSDNDWVITVSINSFGNFIEIKQVEDYLTSVIMIGDKLLCRYTCKEYIYILDVEVYNIKFASRSIVLKANEIKTVKNIRKHHRYEVYLSSSYCVDGTIGENYSIVTNISYSGLSIITRGNLNIDEIIDLSIYFPGFIFVLVKCSVKWRDKINENNLYGLQIIGLDDISQFQYSNFIKKLNRKERTLRKKGEKLL